MHNDNYQGHMAASCTYHLPKILSSPTCSTKAMHKTSHPTKNVGVYLWTNVSKMSPTLNQKSHSSYG